MGLHKVSECTETTQSQGDNGADVAAWTLWGSTSWFLILLWRLRGCFHSFCNKASCVQLSHVVEHGGQEMPRALLCKAACAAACIGVRQSHFPVAAQALQLFLLLQEVHCSCCWISTHVRAWDVSQDLQKMQLIWLLAQLHSSGLDYVKSLLSGGGGTITAWHFIFWDV